jgi:hypothetical protein
MKCQWYEEQLARNEVQLWSHGRPLPQLLAHARECEACGRLVNGELQLRELFIELAESSQRAEPSESVRRRLLAEVDTLRTAGKPRRKLVLAFALAAAALICVVVGLAVMQKRTNAPSVANQKQAAQPTVEASKVERVRSEAAVVPNAKAGSVKRSTEAVSGQKAPTNDFYPTVVCDSLTCAGPSIQVRVQVPASPLLRAGNAGGTVTADLLVGEDGVVRGIRVLE